MSMTIAVVVPVYNRVSLIRRALASIARQSHPPAELIVVDDGSTDATAQSAREWLTKHASFPWRVVTTANGGPAAARKIGEQLADPRHGYVAFLDSDDEWPEHFLANGLRALRQRPDAVGSVADRQTLRDGELYAFDDMALFAKDPVLFVLERGGGLLQCCVFRRSFYRRAGGFDPRWRTGEDGKMLVGLAVLGPFVHAPGAPVLVYQRTAPAADGDAMSVSLADPRDFWTWAEQMEQLVRALPRTARRGRRAAICSLMLQRWGEARLILRQNDLMLLSRRANRRRQIWHVRMWFVRQFRTVCAR